jgi:hypothetical protein
MTRRRQPVEIEEGRLCGWRIYRNLGDHESWPFRCSILIDQLVLTDTLMKEIQQFNIITFGPLGGDVTAWRYSVVMQGWVIKAGFREEKDRLVFLLRWLDLGR